MRASRCLGTSSKLSARLAVSTGALAPSRPDLQAGGRGRSRRGVSSAAGTIPAVPGAVPETSRAKRQREGREGSTEPSQPLRSSSPQRSSQRRHRGAPSPSGGRGRSGVPRVGRVVALPPCCPYASWSWAGHSSGRWAPSPICFAFPDRLSPKVKRGTKVWDQAFHRCVHGREGRESVAGRKGLSPRRKG